MMRAEMAVVAFGVDLVVISQQILKVDQVVAAILHTFQAMKDALYELST